MTLATAASGGLPLSDDPINVGQTVAFALIAAVMVIAALRVVTTRNIVHAAMWLVVVLAGAAAQYILLAAEFVAVTQVLVYIGAVVVLILFGVMLTRSTIGTDADLTRKGWFGGAFVAVLLAGLLAFSLIDTFEDAKVAEERQVTLDGSNTAAVSDSIFTDYLVPFEVISVMLTAALIGAIVIARKE